MKLTDYCQLELAKPNQTNRTKLILPDCKGYITLFSVCCQPVRTVWISTNYSSNIQVQAQSILVLQGNINLTLNVLWRKGFKETGTKKKTVRKYSRFTHFQLSHWFLGSKEPNFLSSWRLNTMHKLEHVSGKGDSSCAFQIILIHF